MANLILKNNTPANDVSLEFNRGSNASWRIVNSSGTLYLRCNYTSTAGSYFDVLSLKYNTGEAIFKDSVAMKKLIISDETAVKHIEFKRAGYNYITTPANGKIGFIVTGATVDDKPCEMIISDGVIYPGTTEATALGSSDKQWSTVYTNYVQANKQLYIASGSTLYLTSANDTSILFKQGSNESGRFDADGLLKIVNGIYPAVTGGIDLGTEALAWRNVYATTLHGSLSGNASSADVLSTPRNIHINLASDNGADFDGSENITPGVYGILDVGNGGTGRNTLTKYSVLVGAGTSAVTMIAPVTAGKLFVSNGTNANPIYADPAMVWDNATHAITWSVNGNGCSVILPFATSSANGIVSTAAQTFGGAKTFASDTDSTSTSTGAVIIKGGAGIAKQLRVGTAATIGTSASIGTSLSVGTTLSVTGNTSLGGTLGVIGDTTLGGTLTVSEDATIVGNAFVGSALYLSQKAKFVYNGTDKCVDLIFE